MCVCMCVDRCVSVGSLVAADKGPEAIARLKLTASRLRRTASFLTKLDYLADHASNLDKPSDERRLRDTISKGLAGIIMMIHIRVYH